MREIGVAALPGEPGTARWSGMTGRPTLDVNGIWGGFTGEGTKTVIPTRRSPRSRAGSSPTRSRPVSPT